MKITAFKYKQSQMTFFSFIIDSNLLWDRTEVLVYGKSDFGYQRELKNEHRKSIENYIKSRQDDFLLPTSIILAIDKSKYENLAKKNIIENDNVTIEEIEIPDNAEFKFRIVDGQHRLAALKELATSIKLNIITMIVDEDPIKKIVEVDTFITINSKAKRIPVDLAELAKYRYHVLAKEDIKEGNEAVEYVAMKIVTDINDTNGVWNKAIKVEIHGDKHGIVGVSAFKKSIEPLVKKFIQAKAGKNIKDLDDLTNELVDIINTAWDICASKWRYCFDSIDGSLTYSGNYYIQKTIGISALNGILSETANSLDGSNLTKENVLSSYNDIINRSNVKIDDWEVGGRMSGLSSESGFAKIRKFIKNETEL